MGEVEEGKTAIRVYNKWKFSIIKTVRIRLGWNIKGNIKINWLIVIHVLNEDFYFSTFYGEGTMCYEFLPHPK